MRKFLPGTIRPAALAFAILLTAGVRSVCAQGGKPPPPPVINPVKVDEAVERGAQFLLAQTANLFQDIGAATSDQDWDGQRTSELVLYTLIYGGVDLNQPAYLQLFNQVMEKPPEKVYAAALRAMALEALDPVKFQTAIAGCAQYLVDEQCENGQWGYGGPAEKSPFAWTPDPEKPVTFTSGKAGTSSGGVLTDSSRREAEKGKGTQAVKRVPIVRRKKGPSSGDNSNTQYALLGLRACLDAGIAIPADVLPLAETWWLKEQDKDGGWGYSRPVMPGTRHAPYGPMVAGGISSIAICCEYQRKPWKNHPAIQRGAAWIVQNFAIDKIPRYDDRYRWLYYYLYSLERAGVLTGMEKFGPHEWYPQGAQFILSAQKPDGSWTDGDDSVTETCFAILFLRRATKPLVKAYSPGH